MSLGVVTLVLVVAGVVADPIVPDWGLLTDFTTEYKVRAMNMKNIVAGAHEHGDEAIDFNGLPIEKEKVHGTIQADVLGQRLQITGIGSEVLISDDRLGPFEGAHLHVGDSGFTLDGPAGYVVVHVRGSAQTTIGKIGLQYCVKLDLAEFYNVLGQQIGGPPQEVVKTMVKTNEPQFAAALNQMPHEDTTINGEHVALFIDSGTYGDGTLGDQVYLGLQHNGVPVGLGNTAPSDGKWKPAIRFMNWKPGAGAIEEPDCSTATSTSAAEMMADPEASRSFVVFDQLVAHLNRAGSKMGFATIPARASQLFAAAAAKELSSQNRDAGKNAWPITAFVCAAGASVGIAFAVMGVAFKTPAKFNEPLLA